MSTLTPWIPLPETDDVRSLVRELNQRLGRRELFWREALQLPIRRTATAISPAGSDHTILVDATSSAVGVTLPLASQSLGLRYNVVKVDSSLNFVVLNRSGTDTISGATFRNITTQWAGLLLQADGTGTWVVLGDTFGPSGTGVPAGGRRGQLLRPDPLTGAPVWDDDVTVGGDLAIDGTLTLATPTRYHQRYDETASRYQEHV